MQRSWHVRKGDQVFVTTGKDKGKTGEVISVNREKDRVYVKGLQMIKKHQRPSPNNPGGIVEKEGSIHISNVMHVDPKENKPTKVGFKVDENGNKFRFAKLSGEKIDN